MTNEEIYQVLVSAWNIEPDLAGRLFGDPIVSSRLRAMAGVYDRLHALNIDGMSDRWPQLPNAGFQGQTPLEAMASGGLETIFKLHGYLDGLLDGQFS